MKASLFSLGGLLARRWSLSAPVPWVIAAAVLTGLSLWDIALGYGTADFMLIGLAGYELVLGLTETPANTGSAIGI